MTSLAWLSASSCASGSMDRGVCVWDVEAAALSSSLRCGKAVTALTASPLGGLLASGHPDGVVRLWDSRGRSSTAAVSAELSLAEAAAVQGSSEGSAGGSSSSSSSAPAGLRASLSRSGSSSWVSEVSWCPTAPHLLAACDFGGSAQLWDIRAPAAPLAALTQHKDKALCMQWLWAAGGAGAGAGGPQELTLVSGGADRQLQSSCLRV